jgi:hypothetical protein
MSSFKIKSTLEEYLVANWTATPIKFEGMPIDYSSDTSFIVPKYVGVANSGFYGSGKQTNGQLQIFCYAQNPVLAYKLSDTVCTFFKCLDLSNDVHTLIPQQQGSAINLDDGFFEAFVTVEANCYS